MIELRKDPVTGRWVIVSTERALRPHNANQNDPPGNEESPCPFCYGGESLTPPEIMAFRPDGSQRDNPGWTLRVVPNRFPALRIEGELNREGVGMYDRMSGVGAHEVIIENPHSAKFEARDAEEIRSAAENLRNVLRMLSHLLGNPPYNFYLHNSPLHTNGMPHYHWHMEILPAITTTAGFERGSAFYINPVPPEEAAAELRKSSLYNANPLCSLRDGSPDQGGGVGGCCRSVRWCPQGPRTSGNRPRSLLRNFRSWGIQFR